MVVLKFTRKKKTHLPIKINDSIFSDLPVFHYFANMKKALYLILSLLILSSCYEPERECEKFKNGSFTFTASLNQEEVTTYFTRNDSIEIDKFKNSVDTSSVRWLNDCEYIIKKINPRNKAEEKSIHIKIISTTDDSYTFTYGVVGETKRNKGTAFKTN